ncbi:hypothetical protein [Rummeliibacillus sp. POC4]|uniref:hypothetical protein n=1 Tax=Rummeliibacillus sp. POC4 TaxID=2305899 RepID=UPI000E672B53|nr:hypothetical protein [Rummeliibacillus sp. POC4]RIJ64159.1 hypothetical protein D1606_11640 [Rummeliibacillus sp. POC4]
MNLNVLTEQEAAVLNILEGMGPGVKIKGDRLQEKAHIKTKREFYQVVNSLRKKGFAVGASKKGYGGYFIIQSEKQLLDWHSSTLRGATQEIDIANHVVNHWYKNNPNKGA